MTGFDLDGFGATLPVQEIYSGLVLVNGKAGKDVPGAIPGKQVKDSAPHDLEITVRLSARTVQIVATLDDRQPIRELV